MKVSLLDAGHEMALRARPCPAGVRLYTGDDFNYPELIDGDGSTTPTRCWASSRPSTRPPRPRCRPTTPATHAAARAILDSTQELGRHIFSAPTLYYKTGIAFLSWLNGQQAGFTMVGGLHSGRRCRTWCRPSELADRAGLLLDPELAAVRMRDCCPARSDGVGA